MDTLTTILPAGELGLFDESQYFTQCVQHFSQPIFLLHKDLSILSLNGEAERLLDDSWVNVLNGKISFQLKKDNDKIKAMLSQSTTGQVKHIILRSSENIRRSCTFSLLCETTGVFYLTIQKERINNTCQLDSLSQEYSLTPCEANVLSFMIEGLKPKQIAFELKVSIYTIRAHLRTIYAKLNVKGYNEAVIHAISLLN